MTLIGIGMILLLFINSSLSLVWNWFIGLFYIVGLTSILHIQCFTITTTPILTWIKEGPHKSFVHSFSCFWLKSHFFLVGLLNDLAYFSRGHGPYFLQFHNPLECFQHSHTCLVNLTESPSLLCCAECELIEVVVFI